MSWLAQMRWFAQTMTAGITAFIATNLDDIVILMLFFAQVKRTFRPKHIVIGQYLGFTVLIAASLPGFFGGLVVPKAWIGLLGFVPLAIGVKQLLDRDAGKPQLQTIADEVSSPSNKQPLLAAIAALLPPQTYQVAAITIANGGDNLGIYVPLFANSDLPSLGIILGAFYVMVGSWCFVAYHLTQHPKVADVITRYGNVIVPFVLIGLGIVILTDSGTYHLLPLFQITEVE